MHVEVRVGDSILMFADDFSKEFGMPPLAKGRMPFILHTYVPDADKTWNQAIAAGCKSVMPLADQFWGDRYGHLEDPYGFTWAIATRKETLTHEEAMERQKKAFGAAKATK